MAAGRGGGRLSPLARFATRFPIYLKDARRDPRWLMMFVFGRFVAIRAVYGRARQSRPATQPPAGAPAVQPLATEDPDTIVAALRTSGVWQGLQLPAGAVAAIRHFALDRPCFAGMDRRFPFLAGDHAGAEEQYDRAILVGHFLDTIMDCEAARGVIENRWLRRIAWAYLGVEPKLIAARLWWSFRSERSTRADRIAASQEGFHYDLDDWRQIKFFFYLSDVDELAGPHVYVAGSHRRRPFRKQFSAFVGCSVGLIERRYGPSALTPILGGEGTGFVEDPFGYHRAMEVRDGKRLLLEISFGMSDLIANRRHGELTPRRHAGRLAAAGTPVDA